MERRSIAHIAAGAVVIAACACLSEGTAWSRAARPPPAPAAPVARQVPAHTYTVHAGEGWWQIAHAHGTTLPHLLAANHATTVTPVNAGQKIKLPADARVDPKVAHAAAAPAAPRHAPATAAVSVKVQARTR